ncbi:MAG: ATP-binding protein [Specibacter sp.]
MSIYAAVIKPNTPGMTEMVLARSIGLFSLVLIALALPDLLQDSSSLSAGYLSFVVAIPAFTIAAMIPRNRSGPRRFFAGLVAMLLLLGFLMWHLGVVGNGIAVDARPWSWGIAGAGVGLAGVAGSIRLAGGYGLLFSVLVFLVPAMPAGSNRGWHDSWQDALLTIVMTAVIVAPIWALRQAVRESDEAAEAAVAGFAVAARSEAVAMERRRIDTLTHDIIMSTLTVAAQATTPEVSEAARRGAQSALEQLEMIKHDGGTRERGELATAEWLGRLAASTGTFGAVLHVVGADGSRPATIPTNAARALTQAATEAVRNSSKYAPGSPATVSVSFSVPSRDKAEVAVEITDQGPGFDLAGIPLERMGVRVSIIERMKDARGNAVVLSEPGTGTTVRLKWSRTDGGGWNG